MESTLVRFTILVENLGLLTATGVQIQDCLPANLNFISADSPAYAMGTCLWTIGTLAASASTTLVISATAISGSSGIVLTNTASLFALNETDTNALNDLSNLMVTPGPLIRVCIERRSSNDLVRLFWPSDASYLYQVETATSLYSGVWNIWSNNIPATPPINEEFTVHTPDVRRYFRLGTRAP